MPLFALQMLVGCSIFVALANWRAGLFLCVLVGMLQDPVRKVTPDTPAYLTLAFVPVYLAMLVNLASTQPLFSRFRRDYPQLLAPALLFFVSLLVSTVQMLSYGLQYIPTSMLGLFSYAGGVPALFLGYHYLRGGFENLDRPLIVLAVLISLMLIGAPLEYFDVAAFKNWLGTVALNKAWLRWYSSTEYVKMISGFHRSPEIMGWHAMLLVVICAYLIVRRPQSMPLWIGGATWGLACALLSGRRKMVLIIIVFVLSFVLASEGWYRRRPLIVLLIACVLIVPLITFFVDDRYLATAESTLPGAGSRLSKHAYDGPLWLVSIVGPFGYGVGAKTQGAQHLEGNIETPLTEGGFEKILVELGLFGTAAFLLLLFTLARCMFRCMRMGRGDTRTGATALGAFVIANLAGFVVAFQIYGDPFVVVLIGFAGGLLLSTPRLVEQEERNTPRELADHDAQEAEAVLVRA